MLKAASLVGLAASIAAVTAQNTSASNSTTTVSANNGTNPLIPTDVSAGCQNFLADINGDPTLAACTQPVLDIVTAVDPAAGGSAPGNVATLLNQTCAAAQDDECDDSYVRGLLHAFAGNCSAELEAANPVIVANYDVLYMMQPFREAMCSVDSKTGTYCIVELASGTAPSSSGSMTTSSALAANSTAAVPTSSGVANIVTNSTTTTSHAASSFDITAYAGAALTPGNLYVQLTNQDAATVLVKRQSSVALPSGAPSCATNCWSSKISDASQYGLDPTSASSLCGNSDWVLSYTTCVSQNCDSSDASAATSAEQTVCSSGSSTTSSSSSSSGASSSGVTSQTATAPNATTFAASNLPYLFLSANMTSSFACTQCTKTVLLRYLQWESSIPYVSGLAASPLLAGQTALWSGLSATCGGGFTSSIEQGTTAGSALGGAGTLIQGSSLSGLAAIAAALLSSVVLL